MVIRCKKKVMMILTLFQIKIYMAVVWWTCSYCLLKFSGFLKDSVAQRDCDWLWPGFPRAILWWSYLGLELAEDDMHYHLNEVVVGEELVGDGVHGGVHIWDYKSEKYVLKARSVNYHIPAGVADTTPSHPHFCQAVYHLYQGSNLLCTILALAMAKPVQGNKVMVRLNSSMH